MKSNCRPMAALCMVITLFSCAHANAMTLDAMGLSAYRNLKDDQFDFSALDRAEHLLAKLDKRSFRPNHCPLNQTTGQDLLEKLQQLEAALQSSACKEYKDGYLTSFSASVSKMGQTYLTSPVKATDATGVMNTLAQQSYYRSIGDMVGSLSSLVSDSRCAFDIKERGLIPVVSDILGSASVSALFMPNQYSFIAGMSGLAITSSLKIISSLLKPDYDMSKPKDRENFVKLACSFYDLRSDLEKNNFLRIPSDRDHVNHLLLQSYIQALQSMITWLELAKSESVAQLKLRKDGFVVDQIGAAKLAFYRDIPALKEKICTQMREAQARSLAYRLNLVIALEKIAVQLPQLHLNAEAYNFFSDVDADIAVFTNYKDTLFAPNANKKSDQELSTHFAEALSNIEAILAQEIRAAEEDWQLIPADDDTSYGQLTMAVMKLFDDQMLKIETTKQKLIEKEGEVGKILARKNFTADDEGTHIDHAIVEEIKTIQKSIYGHYGWRFYEYVRDHATAELTAFYNNFYAFRGKYFAEGGRRLTRIADDHTRRVACATAANILLSINNSRSLVNMATDFFFTNRDFFHENVGEIDFHLKVIPTGRSIERQMLQEAQSMAHAQRRLARIKSAAFPTAILEASYFEHPKVGDLMMGQTYADKTIAHLYHFQDINTCGR